MKKQQRNLVNGVLSNLLQTMDCSTMLLAKLQQKRLINNEESEIAESKNTNKSKCAYLIKILLKRQDAFLQLYEVLVELNQSGASNELLRTTKQKLPEDYEKMLKINEKHQFNTDEKYFQKSPPNTNLFVSSKKLTIFIISTTNIELTTKKIRDTVENLYVKTKRLSISQSGLITLWTQAFEMSELLEKLTSNDDKHIIVTSQTVEIIKNQVETHCKSDNVLTCTDTFSWNDLTENFQTKIHSHKVRILNKLLTLEEVFENHKMDEDSLKNLDEQFLIQLINNKNPSIFRNTIPSKPKYYVKRTIQSRYMLSLLNIENFGKDVFLFSGWEKSDMTSYFKKMPNTASNQIDKKAVTDKFIVLESETQFSHICKLTSHPVHWIHQIDKHLKIFVWIKSRGDITSIQKMVMGGPGTQKSIPEDDFSKKIFCSENITDFRSPICIIDSPGMGKTELIANIGRSLKQAFPDQLVVFVHASDFAKNIKENLEIGSNVAKQIFKECMRRIGEIVCSSNKFTNELFQSCIKNGLKINLLLDGYDEIPSTNIKLAEDILKHFGKRETNVRIFVSGRTQDLESLEKALSVLAYKILPFSKEEQQQFLVSYWTHAFRNMQDSVDANRLEAFTSHCLNTVKKKIPKSDREFAGVPLQCLLIGIVFKQSACDYAKPGNYFNECITNIGFHSVSDLFETCIEVKFKDCRQKHHIIDFDKRDCMYAHACHAIKLIFPDFSVQLPVEAKELLKYGILEPTTQTGKIQQFLHRTFAEYLVSYVAIDQFQGHRHKYIDSEAGQLLLNLFETSESFRDFNFHGQVTFDFVNWMCLYFVNQKCDELLRLNKDSTLEIKGIAFDYYIRHMALACAKHDFQHILHLLLKTTNRHLRQPQFVESLLIASVCFAKWHLVQFVCNYFEEVMRTSKIKYDLRHVTLEHQFIKPFIFTSLLHVAIGRADYDVVNYLCEEKGFASMVKTMSLYGLAHGLAINTGDNDGTKINKKVKILEYLSKLNSKVLTESDRDDLPMFSYNTHPEIVRRFVELMQQNSHFISPVLQVYVLLPDKDMKLTYFSFQDICSSLDEPEPKEKHITNLKSLLIYLLETKVELPEKLLMTAKEFMNLNTLFDMTEGSILAYQKLAETTNVEYLTRLFKCGMNFFGVSESNQNLLHMLPTTASVEFLRFMIESKVSVKLMDKDGNMPLHTILAQKQCNETIIKTLIEEMLQGGDSVNDCWNSALKTAAKHGNCKAVTILLEKVSYMITIYNDSLFDAMIDWKHDTGEQTDIVDSLIKYGADINYVTQDADLQQKINSGGAIITYPMLERLLSHGFKCSPVAATNTLVCSIKDKTNYDSKHKNGLFRKLVQLGADLNKKDEEGNTLLHKATKEGQLEYAKMLMSIDGGLSPNCLNNLNETPLHLEIKDQSKQLQILRVLVGAGGDLCAKDGNNQVALFRQHLFGSYKITKPFVEFLLSQIQNMPINDLSECYSLREIMMTAVNLRLEVAEHFLNEKLPLFLHLCTSFSRTKYTEALLTKHPPLNNQDGNGNTPLHVAFSHHSTNLQFIKNLEKAGADINIKNNLGYTPAECFNFQYYTCSYTEMFKFLDIDLNNVPNIIVQNCFNTIKTNKSPSGIHFLSTLATEGINVLADVRPEFILKCARVYALSLIRFVHSSGCDLTTKDYKGNTILHHSLLGPIACPHFFHYLLDYALATGNGELLCTTNFANKSPLMCAVEKFDVLKCSLDHFKEMNVDFNFADDNQTPLIVTAIKHGRSVAFIKLLQKYGCSLEPLINGKWRNLCHKMVKDGRLTNLQLQMLFDIGYNVNTKDKNGNNLLHAAILGNKKNLCATVDFLLENLVDTNAKNKDGVAPFDMIAVLTAQYFGNRTDFTFTTLVDCKRENARPPPVRRRQTEPSLSVGFSCKGCRIAVRSLPYKCLLCINYNFCSGCINRNLHPNHIFAVIKNKQQNDLIQKFHELNFNRIDAGWKYFHGDSSKDTSEKASWKTTCSCCKKEEHVRKLYMCLRCRFNQCEICWKSCQNTHLMAEVFTLQQCDTFSKLFRLSK